MRFKRVALSLLVSFCLLIVNINSVFATTTNVDYFFGISNGMPNSSVTTPSGYKFWADTSNHANYFTNLVIYYKCDPSTTMRLYLYDYNGVYKGSTSTPYAIKDGEWHISSYDFNYAHYSATTLNIQNFDSTIMSENYVISGTNNLGNTINFALPAGVPVPPVPEEQEPEEPPVPPESTINDVVSAIGSLGYQIGKLINSLVDYIARLENKIAESSQAIIIAINNLWGDPPAPTYTNAPILEPVALPASTFIPNNLESDLTGDLTGAVDTGGNSVVLTVPVYSEPARIESPSALPVSIDPQVALPPKENPILPVSVLEKNNSLSKGPILSKSNSMSKSNINNVSTVQTLTPKLNKSSPITINTWNQQNWIRDPILNN